MSIPVGRAKLIRDTLSTLALAVLACCSHFSTAWAAAAGSCVEDSISLRPATVTGSEFSVFGQAIGETFYARDTVITGMTFWRPATDRSAIGAHLWVVGVDTLLHIPRPDVTHVLLDGPTVTVYDSNPPGQVIEMPFSIDPPLVLPGPGYYAWLLQPENCFQGEAWNIVADYNNPYPDGVYWIGGRVVSSCYLRGMDTWGDSTDLLFKIDFCRTSATPTLRSTWGALKVIYR